MTDRSSMSILLVDDDPDACALFRMVMKHHNLSAEVLGSAESALEYLQTHNPDIVIMDIFLPGLDGFHALKQIRKASLAPNSRFIATTAYYTDDTEQEVYSRGFDGYIPKPFDAAGLADYLQRVLDGN